MLEALGQFIQAIPTWMTLVFGVAALLGGGTALVEGAVGIARRLGVPTLIVGLTVVAFGTSAPELAFNLGAALTGHPDLSFGNVVGSNIANIGLVLGMSALVRPLAVTGHVTRRELPILMTVTVVTLGLAFFGRRAEAMATFSRADGVVLLIGFGFVCLSWLRAARLYRDDPIGHEAELDMPVLRPRPIGLSVVLAVIGCVLLPSGAELTKVGALRCATALGWSEAVAGLTIVAIATSLPEVATSVVAAIRGHTDLAVGNVVGSNLFNILFVLGTTCTIAPVGVPASGGWWDLAVMSGLTLLLFPLATSNGRLERAEGAILLAVYVAYMATLV